MNANSLVILTELVYFEQNLAFKSYKGAGFDENDRNKILNDRKIMSKVGHLTGKPSPKNKPWLVRFWSYAECRSVLIALKIDNASVHVFAFKTLVYFWHCSSFLHQSTPRPRIPFGTSSISVAGIVTYRSEAKTTFLKTTSPSAYPATKKRLLTRAPHVERCVS